MRKMTEQQYDDFKILLDNHFKGKVKRHQKRVDGEHVDLEYYTGAGIPAGFVGTALLMKAYVSAHHWQPTWGNNDYQGGKYKIKYGNAYTGFKMEEKLVQNRHVNLIEADELTIEQAQKDIEETKNHIIEYIMSFYEGDIYTTRKKGVFRSYSRLLSFGRYEGALIIYTSTIVGGSYKNPDSSVKKAPAMWKLADKEEVKAYIMEFLNPLSEMYLTKDNDLSQKWMNDFKKQIL